MNDASLKADALPGTLRTLIPEDQPMRIERNNGPDVTGTVTDIIIAVTTPVAVVVNVTTGIGEAAVVDRVVVPWHAVEGITPARQSAGGVR